MAAVEATLGLLLELFTTVTVIRRMTTGRLEKPMQQLGNFGHMSLQLAILLHCLQLNQGHFIHFIKFHKTNYVL